MLGVKGELLDVDSAEPCSASDFVWEADPDFPEVPLELLRPALWDTVVARPWRRSGEGILVLESRALMRGLEVIVSLGGLFGSRALILVDNLSV